MSDMLSPPPLESAQKGLDCIPELSAMLASYGCGNLQLFEITVEHDDGEPLQPTCRSRLDALSYTQKKQKIT